MLNHFVKLNWKGITALALIFILLFSSCGRHASDYELALQAMQNASSGSDSSQMQAEPVETVQLPYQQQDSLNPYLAQTTLNQKNTALFYESLIKLSPDYEPIYVVAENAVRNGNTWTVAVRQGLTFWDGSTLSAQDVAVSFQKAMESSYYSQFFSNVESYRVLDGNTLEFVTKQPDAQFIMLLTFPIVKSGTESNSLPVGSGRFRPQEGAENVFIRNSEYTGDFAGSVQQIELVNYPDFDSMLYGLKVGEIDLLFSESDSNESQNISSNIQVPLNNLLFLGFRKSASTVSQLTFRQAITQVVDKSELVSTAFSGRAQEAVSPFSPQLTEVAELESEAVDLQAAGEILDGLGYVMGEDGYRTLNGQRLTLRVLVNSENNCRVAAAELLIKDLRSLGIECELISVTFEEYNERLKKGEYDLFLGEMKLSPNGDLTSLLVPDEGESWIFEDNITIEAYNKWKDGQISLSDFVQTFNQQLPFLPLLFRMGTLSYSRNFSFEIVATEQDIFYNIQDW